MSESGCESQLPALPANIERLLSVDADIARREAIAAFDQVAEGRDVVIFGAGNLGRKLVAAMRRDGTAPIAFTDNADRLWGTSVERIPVLSPADAAARHPECVFVIAIWGAGSSHRQEHSRAQLTALGVKRICSFPLLAWKHTSVLPHFLIDLPDGVIRAQTEVRACDALWSDEASRAEYRAKLMLCIGDISSWGSNRSAGSRNRLDPGGRTNRSDVPQARH